MKDLFTDYPHIDKEVFISSTEFWTWLKNQDKAEIDVFTTAIENYLSDRGFKLETHYIDQTQLKYHKYVFEHFHWSGG